MKILYLFSTIIVMSASTSKCSDAKKLDKKAPEIIGQAYLASANAEDVSGGFGYILYIPMRSEENMDILLDSVYFRNQIVKLDRISEDSNIVYMGQFDNFRKSNDDVIMSSNPLDEMANKPPNVPQKIPFRIDDDECLVSYKFKGGTRYFKIENIKERFFSENP